MKICGLTREADVRTADEAGADFLGFILAPSKRRITPKDAAIISDGVSAARVAVTVNATETELDTLMADFAPDYLQFHGDESVEAVMSAAAHYGVQVIRALPIASRADLIRAERFAAADILLYDAKPPEGEMVRGGHGTAFDWRVLDGAPLPRFWALAGGLTPDNVTAAITATKAPMVDTSSGVETAPGIKDEDAIRAFIRAAKGI